MHDIWLSVNTEIWSFFIEHVIAKYRFPKLFLSGKDVLEAVFIHFLHNFDLVRSIMLIRARGVRSVFISAWENSDGHVLRELLRVTIVTRSSISHIGCHGWPLINLSLLILHIRQHHILDDSEVIRICVQSTIYTYAHLRKQIAQAWLP
jgi:hypothetical protein